MLDNMKNIFITYLLIQTTQIFMKLQIIEQQQNRAKPNSYAELMQIVGNIGTYQYYVFALLFINFIFVALIFFNTSFLFLRPNLNCQELGYAQQNCQSEFCLRQEQAQITQNQIEPNDIYSLANEFGPFYCKKAHLLNALRVSTYFGAFASVFFISYADLLGRKATLVLSTGIQLLGTLILAASFNIWMVAIGLVLMGLGCASAFRVGFILLAEIFDNTQRQKIAVKLQAGIAIGSALVGVFFWFVPHWRKNIVIFYIIPCLIQLLGYIFYLEQTPKFLIQDTQKIVKSLNRIGQINKKQSNLISSVDIESVKMALAEQNQEFNTIEVKISDLFTFQSLRWITIAMGVTFFCKKYITYGPLILIDEMGMNIFINQIVLGLSQCVAIPLAYIYIQRMPRKVTGLICLGSAALFFLVFKLVNENQKCQLCLVNIIQLVVLFILRIVTTFYYPVMNIYALELFPLRIRGTGIGLLETLGALSSLTSQYVLKSVSYAKIDPMIVLMLISVIGTLSICFLPETLDQPLKDQIQEIQIQKNQYIEKRQKQNLQV